MGYYFIFMGLEFRHDSAMVKRLDNESFSTANAITIKVPMAIPYSSGSEEFNRVDGKFVHEGQVYRLVKQRFLNDTLTIVCVRDHQDERIKNALGDYLKTYTEHNADQSSNAKVAFTFIKDFISQSFSVTQSSFGWETLSVRNSPPRVFISSYYAAIVHPPERA